MNDIMPMFSIIVPCYNLQDVIKRTLDNILSQSFNNYEVIMIDDGSEDKTLEILREYEKNDSRIKVFTKPNGGVSSARNFGIEKASGMYLYFFDGDDLIDKDLLNRADEVLNKNEIAIFAFGYKRINSSGKTIKKYTNKKHDKRLYSNIQYLNLFLYKKINLNICSMIVDRNLILENNICFDENTMYTEDIEFLMKLLTNNCSIYYDSTEYFMYVYREGSAVNKHIHRENFDVYKRIKKQVEPFNNQGVNYYLCIHFIYMYRSIIKKGSNKQTVEKFLKSDNILENFTFIKNKYSYIVSIFILLYKPLLKPYILKKYKIN